LERPFRKHRSLATSVLVALTAMLAPLVVLAGLQLVVGDRAAHRSEEAAREIADEVAKVIAARDALRALEATVVAQVRGDRRAAAALPGVRSRARAAVRALTALDEEAERSLARAADRDLAGALAVLDRELVRPIDSRRGYPLAGFYAGVRAADRRTSRMADLGLEEIARDADRAHRGHRVQLAVLFAVLVVSLLFALLQARRLRQRIRRPLRSLTDAARRIGEGQPVGRLEVDTRDEFGAVAEAFNTMAARVAGSRAALQRQALHDGLTGLPNRLLLVDRLAHALAPGRRDAQGEVAVLVLDLDDFKRINDSFGHGAGDDLLAELAGRLSTAVRPEDTVARLGGDEFAVLLYGMPSAEQALATAERLRAAVERPATVGGRRVLPGVSVGVALGGAGASAEELLRNADAAMYRAKRERRGPLAFEQWMHEQALRRLEMEDELRRAVADRALELRFQPIVEIATARVVAVEALVRWPHSERGMISPLEFIPLAEETGVILDLGQWVLDEAAAAAKRLANLGVGSVSVNVSPSQFAEHGFAEAVIGTAARHGVAPGRLMLEITEGLLMADPEAAEQQIRRLHDAGFRVALDDFGTGFSSLSYLCAFSVDVLKIDRSFVRGVADPESSSRAVAEAIVALARTLGMATVAEGVEDEEQRAALEQLGCSLAQGFLFDHPLTEEDLVDGLARVPPRGGSRRYHDSCP